MSKKEEILSLLCEEFNSQCNPFTLEAIAKKIVAIRDSYKSQIQELNKDTECRITNTLNEITELRKNNAIIISKLEQNQTLLDRQVEIEKEYNSLKEKQTQFEKLQNKNNELQHNQEFIDSFAENLKKINESIDAKISDFTGKLSEVQTLLSSNDLENKLSKIIDAVKSNLQKIKQDNITSCLSELPKMQTEFSRIDSEINTKIDEHNNFAKQINNLKDAFNNSSDKLKLMQEAYKRHIEEDKNILKHFNEKGEFKMDTYIKSNLDELDKLFDNIENAIKGKIDERRDLPVATILERQGYNITEN
jgi:Skp family chaperone for outer membrane proteins